MADTSGSFPTVPSADVSGGFPAAVSSVPVPAATAATDIMEGKPLCGGGEEVGEYDLPLHVLALCKSEV